VEATAAFADRVLDATLQKAHLAPQDRALLTELFYGTLRQQGMLDARLDALLTKPIGSLPVAVRAALRLGAYQLLMMRVPAYSAVNESVKLVGKKYGALTGVVNGTLRQLARQQPAGAAEPGAQPDDGSAAARAAHPPGLRHLIETALGATDGAALMRANLTRPQISVRVNTTRVSPAQLRAQLQAAGIDAQPSPYCADSLVLPPAGSVAHLPGFDAGLMAVQDGAATLVGHLLAPEPGSTVVDLCAAPGGKAMHAAALMGNVGRIIACDVHPGRLQLIERNAARLGHPIVETLLGDMSAPGGQQLLAERLGPIRPSHVMLDAPCSALGTLRRHPELRRKDGTNVEALVQLQRLLLEAAGALLPVGGVLVYAVCTFTAAEGPEQIEAFLARHADFELEAPPQALTAVSDGRFLRTSPHEHGLDGFFAARLRRRATILRQPGAIP
jgi:16S rRNA (cytosine967-C5)-methyltransferase